MRSEDYVVREETSGHYSCTLCGQSSAQKHVVTDHVDGQHIRLRRYACDVCPEGEGPAYTTKYMLRRHMREKHK